MGEYQYRLTAWNAYGWSDYAPSGICTTANASLPCPPELCWQPEGCRQPAGLLEAVATPGAAFGFGWRVVCSMGGALLVVLLAGVRVMSSGQLEALAGLLQNSWLQGVRSRLLTCAAFPSLRPPRLVSTNPAEMLYGSVVLLYTAKGTTAHTWWNLTQSDAKFKNLSLRSLQPR